MIGFRNDSYIEARLGRWGMYQRWLRRQRSFDGVAPRGAGSWFALWGKQNHGATVGAAIDPCPVDEAEAHETTRCIGALSTQELRDVIVEIYMYPSSKVDEHINHLGCCKQTYYNRLYAAHDELLGYFNDAAAGLALPLADAIYAVGTKRMPSAPVIAPLGVTRNCSGDSHPPSITVEFSGSREPVEK